MNETSKNIRDPIHGDITLEGVFLDLIETPDLQRLHNIKQLGFAHLVFPGAHHTRLEHSLGAYHMAIRAAEKLELDSYDRDVIACAALLHDIGHGPFSHTLESILRDSLDVDHVDLSEELIFGIHAIYDELEKEIVEPYTVFDILNKYHIKQKDIADVIRGNSVSKPYLSQLLDSSIDVDQLDYLTRDAYYTGVAYGLIDIERFLQTLTLVDNKLAVLKKGVGVVENILMARTLMYSSVYFHKTVRIAELMLSKAIELYKDKDPFELFKLTDGELIHELKKMGKYQKQIGIRLKFRRLFKQAYYANESTLDESKMKVVKSFENISTRRQKEEEIEEKLNIPKGHLIIDAPYAELHLSEPRIDNTEIMIIDDSEVKSLDEYTPIANAIRSRHVPDWAIMLITDTKHREIVSKNAEKLLFD